MKSLEIYYLSFGVEVRILSFRSLPIGDLCGVPICLRLSHIPRGFVQLLFHGQHCTLWENRSGIYSGRENTAGSLPWSGAEGKSWRIVNTLELLVWSSQEEKGKKEKKSLKSLVLFV